jgi:hypothetical protein
MARLIDVQLDFDPPAMLEVDVGDVVAFAATGAHVRSGGGAVEMLGAFRTAVVGTDGRVLSPEGPPSTVLFRARSPGRATVEIVGGDPWGKRRTVTVEVVIRRTDGAG